MRKVLLIFTILLVLILIASFIVLGLTLTGKAVDISDNFNKIGTYDPSKIPFDYSYTTAICEGNKCRDFVVTCLDGEAIHLDPVSGMVIFSDNWEDLREINDSLCGS